MINKKTINKNEVICELFNSLNDHNIVYCHWKSNKDLGNKFKGEIEYDLLVARSDVQSFESVLAKKKFKRVNEKNTSHVPSIHHFYRYDEISNTLIHMHALYGSLITGESLIKNYKLPLEHILLDNREFESSIPIPNKSLEFSLFVVRMMLKHASVIEYILALRDYENIKEELIWLTNRKETIVEAQQILGNNLPEITVKIFNKSANALKKNNAYLQRFLYGQVIKRRLKSYRRYCSFLAVYLTVKVVCSRLFRRIFNRKGSKTPVSGGVLIAFVGPEATGKSTLVSETHYFFSRFLDTKKVHLGKPPFTLLSLLPRSLLFIYRLFGSMNKSNSRVTGQSHNIENDNNPFKVFFYFLYSIKSIFIALDRKVLAIKAYRWAGQGKIVICDRYPTMVVGAMDSPMIRVAEGGSIFKKLFLLLENWERRFYSHIPAPDAVIRLTVPLEVAVRRNQMREKKGKESELYVRNRHGMANKFSFPDSVVHCIDTNKPQKETVKEARKIIWDIL